VITRIVEKPGSFRKTRNGAEREYEYTLLVTTNSPNDTESVIENDPRIPHIGSPYVSKSYIDASAVCLENGIAKGDAWLRNGVVAGYVWEVSVKHTTRKTESSGKPIGKEPKNPLRWPTEINWSGKPVEKNFGKDAYGTLLVNSAGDRLRDVPPVVTYHALVSLTRYEARYNPVRAMQFAGKINATTWFACPPHTAKMEWPAAQLVWIEDADIYVWRITYSFEINPDGPDGWMITEVPDVGTMQLLSSGDPGFVAGQKKKTRVRDGLGEPTSEPQFLDGFGYQLANTQVEAGNIKYGRYRFYKTIDFNQLGLP